MITATISQEAKKLVIRVQRNIIGIITEPCKETKYRYEVNVNGKKRSTRRLPDAVLMFDDLTDSRYCGM